MTLLEIDDLRGEWTEVERGCVARAVILMAPLAPVYIIYALLLYEYEYSRSG